jgi:23S rRNA (guanosine2251-2'-O)-methyltransferase
MGKYRSEMIFGYHSVIEAIRSGRELEKILIKQGARGQLTNDFLLLVREKKIPCQRVPIEKINKITRKNHQGIIAFLALIEYRDIEQIVPELYESGETPLFLILDRITDVRNFGAIARTAECAGIHGIVISERESAQVNSDAIKTSAGALYNIPVCRSNNLVKTVQFLKNSGLQIVAAFEKSATMFYEVDFNPPTAIILGSEEKGVRKELQSQSDIKAKIPLFGKIESLNVSVAAAVMVYEAVKQRKQSGPDSRSNPD